MKKDNDIVAVLLTVYKNDTVEYFSRAVESIINQSYGVEYIRIYLYIDGIVQSTISDYFEQKAGFFYKIKKSDDNKGLAAGLNCLIKNIENEEFIFRMDSDDISLPDRFSKQINYMKNNPDVGILGGSISEFVGKEENITFTRKYKLQSKQIKNEMMKSSPFAHVSVCFRRQVLFELSEYPDDYIYNEDLAMWVKSLKYSIGYANLPDVLVLVRMDGAYSRRGKDKILGEIRLYSQAIRFNNGTVSNYIYLFFRVISRLLPSSIIGFLYKSKLRKLFVS